MSNNRQTATFDNNQLTAVPGLSILSTNPYVPAKRKISAFLLARRDKSRHNSAFYTDRNISVVVGISMPTRDQAEQSLDTLFGLIQGREKELVLAQSGTVRKYYCTWSDAPMRKSGGSYIELELIFNCSDNFGYETAYRQVLSLNNITSSTRGDTIPISWGSAPWQVPVISVTYSALTGGTLATVLIGNSATGQQISITRTWSAGDRIDIDSFNKTVKVNGAVVAFTGAIPEWVVGLGNWSYSDNMTTRTFNASIIYYPRYV